MDGTLDFDCGIAYARLETWLRDELRLSFDGSSWLYPTEVGPCAVQIEPLESRPLGIVQLERSRLFASGGEDALALFNKAFTLRFVSAGG